jgi:hypothetical protein
MVDKSSMMIGEMQKAEIPLEKHRKKRSKNLYLHENKPVNHEAITAMPRKVGYSSSK